MSRIDGWISELSRTLARRTSRRGLLSRTGAAIVGAAALPLLPISRPARADSGEPDLGTPEGNPEGCGYWRYCAIDGFLASCCGGSHTSCPPGTEMSPITWLGTCRNPIDGVEYVISYNDCCGKDICGRCFCRRTEGDRPVYLTHRNNDIDWCMGTSTNIYNSTVAVVVGVSAKSDQKA